MRVLLSVVLCLITGCTGQSRTGDAEATPHARPVASAVPDSSWAIFPEQLHWSVSRQTSPVDGATRLQLQREGRDTVLGSVRPGGPLELSIQCYGGRPVVKILAIGDGGAGDEIPVKYRVDAGPVHVEAWPSAALGMVGLAPEPRSLLRALLAADTLHIERLFGGGSMISAISVHELRDYRDDIIHACGA